MTEESIACESTLLFDYPHYSYCGELFVPSIFDAGPFEKVPKGFNAVRIPLDGTMRSDLNWSSVLAAAKQHRDNGLKILWDMDLGLFSRLLLPLSEESQLHALRLSLGHFSTEIWPEFVDDTLGIALYRGTADFSRHFPWSTELRAFLTHHLANYPDGNKDELTRLYCRDCCAQYLGKLVAGLPGSLQPYLLLDGSGYASLRHLLQILHRDSWERFFLAVKGAVLPITSLGWDSTSLYGNLGRKEIPSIASSPALVGLCLPSAVACYNLELDAALAHLQQSGKPYRVVAEEYLTAEWDGLDELIVIASSINPLLQRKLQGFSAAGGTVHLWSNRELPLQK